MPSRTETPRTALLDVNVLVALTVSTHVHHRDALRWFEAEGHHAWATTPLTEAGLVRLLLNEAVVGERLSSASALSVLRGVRSAPGWRFLPDDSSLAEAVVETTALVGHRQVSDFHLLNLAAGVGARLATFDRALPTYLVAAGETVLVVPVA